MVLEIHLHPLAGGFFCLRDSSLNKTQEVTMFNWLRFLFPSRKPAAPRAQAVRRKRITPVYILHKEPEEGVCGKVSCSATAIHADE